MAIAHTHTEQVSRPSIVNLTIQWACQNRPKIERSEEVSGSACCATSAGFMAYPLGYPAIRLRRQTGRRFGSSDQRACRNAHPARWRVSGFLETLPGRWRLDTKSREI